jgi:pimeloyl-ACP methyl ester carboxylesterase
LQCAESLNTTDFRDELHTIQVPTLIIHGTDDKNVPIEVSSEKTAKAIKNNTFIVYEGAPHGLFYTEKDKLNKDLLEFLNS